MEKRQYALAAERRVHAERRAAERQVEGVAKAREMERQAGEVRRQVAEGQLRAARESHRGAVSRLRHTLEATRQQEPALESKLGERLEKRATSVIGLKTATEAAAAELRSSNARKEDQRAKVVAAREEEKEAILGRGGNPYQVFRQIDEDARLAREAKKLKATLTTNMEQLNARMLKQNQEEA